MASIAGFGAGLSGAASSLFAGFASEKKAEMFKIEAKADLLKGKGAQLEGESYDRAKELALVNKQFAAESTAIQGVQADRAITLSLGGTRAGIGAAGMLESGSAMDVLADSASQGALHKQLLEKQGLITGEGYQEQADVYGKMVEASGVAVEAAKLASEGHLKAAEAEETAATGHYIGAGIKAVFGIASLFTGDGLSGIGGGADAGGGGGGASP